MRIEELKLKNFRNYQDIFLKINRDNVILVGSNAQGKTNLLESIYYLATGSTPRYAKDRDLINWNSSFFNISALVENKWQRKTEIELEYANGKKIVKINGVKKNKLQELLGNLNVVMFTPDDLKLIKGSPSDRRGFLNKEISQLSSQYFYYLAQYNKVVEQRNTVLKSYAQTKSNSQLELLSIWDNQLIYYGVKIISIRIKFVANISHFASEYHHKISSEEEKLAIEYHCNIGHFTSESDVKEIEKLFYDKLVGARKEELARYSTVVGPHRDDLLFLINEKEIKNYGSQGQQRSAVLSLKMAQIKLFKEKTDTYPVLLLDDVMSELDQQRRKILLEYTSNNVQTFISTTHLHSFSDSLISNAQVIKVKNGFLAPVKEKGG